MASSRWLLVMLALSLLVLSRAAAAPRPTTVHRIGFLWNASPSFTNALLGGIPAQVAGTRLSRRHALAIQSRYAEDDPARLPGLAAELVALPVAVIVRRVPGPPGRHERDEHDPA